jgi:hypothetical protein
MATPVIAAGATAFGLYVYVRQWQACGYSGVRDLSAGPDPLTATHALTEQPPQTWSETIYLFKEALRYNVKPAMSPNRLFVIHAECF